MNAFLRQFPTMRQEKIATKNYFFGNSFRLFLLALVVVMGVMYVFQTSTVSTRGYEMSDLKAQVQKLERDNQSLQFQIANYRSMQSIEKRLKDSNLVVADNIQYINLNSSAMARR